MVSSPAGAGHSRKPVILLVENNVAMRALIRSLLEEMTPVIHESDNGRSAVEVYATLRPDWVLMDIALGGLDGIAATRAICGADPDAHVVMVTAHGDPAYRRAAADAGAAGFVLKANLLELPALLASAPFRPDPGEGEVS
jgi:DNA-binding NarL/FixJ family response regulator